jgi:hypothetical protein
MIELKNDSLVFSFSDVHPEAKFSIDFQRTLRIPDDGDDYPLPPGLGRFPLKPVDDFADGVPRPWIEHGGIMFPMYQSEALWLNFSSEYLNENETEYPFAVKIATGKINAITGEEWSNSLNENPQDYLVVPEQPWLDGYCIEKGFIRQFVAMPLGSGYSVEEQITGKNEYGGLQIIVYPMKRKVFDKRFPKIERIAEHDESIYMDADLCQMASSDMGLAPGGRMRQKIYDDPFNINDWDTDNMSRCFVHITNSLVWRAITEEESPTIPLTSSEYNKNGFPWFEYYDDSPALSGSGVLKKMKSLIQMGKVKGDNPDEIKLELKYAKNKLEKFKKCQTLIYQPEYGNVYEQNNNNTSGAFK